MLVSPDVYKKIRHAYVNAYETFHYLSFIGDISEHQKPFTLLS